MDCRDRSHPNLVELDDMKGSLSYPGWEDDFESAEKVYKGKHKIPFDTHLFRLREKQNIHEGNRRHSRLVALDSLELTYPGHRKDVIAAEERHVLWAEDICGDFKSCLEEIKNKQRVFEGDRTHPNLVKLDKLKKSLSYAGWKVDFKSAERAYTGNGKVPFLTYYYRLEEKQRVHDGDRSHPRLVELDLLKLTYPGYQNDIKKAEKVHCSWADDPCGDFKCLIEEMKNKQSLCDGDRSHPNLVRLDKLKPSLSYPGWKSDFESAELVYTGNDPKTFQVCYYRLRERQRVHDGIRTHRRLVKLDRLEFTYPGYEQHFKLAEKMHLDFPDDVFGDFASLVEEMQNKQRMFRSYRHPQCGFCSPWTQNSPRTANTVKQDGICAVCWDAPTTHVMVPCGHLSVCEQCSEKTLDGPKECPICREKVSQVMKVYFI